MFQKIFLDIWREMVKHSVVHDYLTKELYNWKKTHSIVITLLMAHIVWTILIPPIYIDFHSRQNRSGARKLLLNLIQTSKNNKWYIKQNVQIH